MLAVITGEDLAKANLAWMPTLFFDKQMVLATGKVLFQSQEVAFVVARIDTLRRTPPNWLRWNTRNFPSWWILIRQRIPARRFFARTGKRSPTTFFIGRWAIKLQPTKRFKALRSRRAYMRSPSDATLPHSKPVVALRISIELRKNLRFTLLPKRHMPTERFFLSWAGYPEQNIRVISPDIGGGFGNKVPIYPGYVCAVVASLDPRRACEVD